MEFHATVIGQMLSSLEVAKISQATNRLQGLTFTRQSNLYVLARQ
jgi:hypothetical protein